MYQYKRVTLKSGKDYSKAEKLKENGWKLIELGCYDALFERELKSND